jgi:hypothetical protein
LILKILKRIALEEGFGIEITSLEKNIISQPGVGNNCPVLVLLSCPVFLGQDKDLRFLGQD